MKKNLKIRDIERLENTSLAGTFGLGAEGGELVDATERCVTPLGPEWWTNDCQICIDDTECCDVLSMADLVPATETR